MDSEEKFTYSWGELYETLKGMEKNGDFIEDEFFQKVFKLFDRLDKINSYQEIQEILQEFTLTEYEINRINSSCLDGIIFSINIKYWQPYTAVCKIKFFETAKYYLKHIEKSKCNRYDMLAGACECGNFDLVKLLVENDDYTKDCNNDRCIHHKGSNGPLYWAVHNEHIDIMKYMLSKKYMPTDNYTASAILYVCSKLNSLDIVEELIEKGIFAIVPNPQRGILITDWMINYAKMSTTSVETRNMLEKIMETSIQKEANPKWFIKEHIRE